MDLFTTRLVYYTLLPYIFTYEISVAVYLGIMLLKVAHMRRTQVRSIPTPPHLLF